MTMFSIRPASVEDIPVIRGMAEIVFRSTYADILSSGQMEYMMEWMYSEDSLQKQIETPGKAFFVAFRGDVPAGYVSFETEGDTEEGRRLFHLQKLYVMPEFQRSGLGRQMLEFVKGLLSDWNPMGCRMELNVNRDNPAVGFYRHMGMACDRQGDFPIGKGFYMNDYIYVLDI